MLSKLKLKYIQSLGQKKFRDREDLFIAEGPKLVSDLIADAPASILELYALPAWIRENEKLTGSLNVTEIDEIELERISLLKTPNKLLAIVKKFPPVETFTTKGKITLVLDDVQDPGNLGTIIRIADWFGIKQIVCSGNSVDCYNPKVVQATMGSIARVELLYTDLEQWLLTQKDTRIFAATLEGRDVSTMDRITEGIILAGNEAHGINPSLLNLANEQITIPRKGRAESLNVAVATGILLACLA